MITGKILRQQGWPEGKLIGLAKRAAAKMERQGLAPEAVLARLEQARTAPDSVAGDPLLGELAAESGRQMRRAQAPSDDTLLAAPLLYGVWGAEQIEAGARAQMDAAMRLPISVAGALMPDAHQGYGLPIGGVLATDAVVIPFAVGVDIACRMRLSVYHLGPEALARRPEVFTRSLMDETRFGMGAEWESRQRPEHDVLDDATWKVTKLLASLHGKAVKQLGTSGTGNHFVEWGSFTLTTADPQLGLEPGQYLALLSHSGSRGVGFTIANTFSKLAEQRHPHLDKQVRHLAWLSLDSEVGQEYWEAMELAGRFASANHQIIHRRVASAAGLREVAAVENHHNFAWREQVPDPSGPPGATREAIVHRKGATPAGSGVLGIIPGSMGDAGFVVRGRGEGRALHSASHGAGRAMSRRAALDSISKSARDRYLQDHGVTLLGGGLDEAPQAYKRVETVIAAQSDLVEIIGRFAPRLVRMADEPGDI